MNVNTRALVAEAVGTFALVAAICGGALFSASDGVLGAAAGSAGGAPVAIRTGEWRLWCLGINVSWKEKLTYRSYGSCPTAITLQATMG